MSVVCKWVVDDDCNGFCVLAILLLSNHVLDDCIIEESSPNRTPHTVTKPYNEDTSLFRTLFSLAHSCHF